MKTQVKEEVPLYKLATDESITYHVQTLRHNTPLSIFDEIAVAFEDEPHLLPVTGDELRRSFFEGNAVVALYNNGRDVVGYSRITQITGNDDELGGWYELGSTWVHKDFRNRGINLGMYNLFLPLKTDKNILATTTNPNSYALGKEIGLVDVTRSEIPKRLWLASCTCPQAKMGATCAEKCKHARGEEQQVLSPCYFRITPQTKKRITYN